MIPVCQGKFYKLFWQVERGRIVDKMPKQVALVYTLKAGQIIELFLARAVRLTVRVLHLF